MQTFVEQQRLNGTLKTLIDCNFIFVMALISPWDCTFQSCRFSCRKKEDEGKKTYRTKLFTCDTYANHFSDKLQILSKQFKRVVSETAIMPSSFSEESGSNLSHENWKQWPKKKSNENVVHITAEVNLIKKGIPLEMISKSYISITMRISLALRIRLNIQFTISWKMFCQSLTVSEKWCNTQIKSKS